MSRWTKLLKPTEAELSGLVDREHLEGISGRGRKRQIELARQLGLEDYPTPASGCLLTDEGYSQRLRDLMKHEENFSFNDLNLLRVGRHFRLDACTKIIVGRDEQENQTILSYRQPESITLEAVNVGSPITLLVGEASDNHLRTAAAITARYSSARKKKQVEVAVKGKAESDRALFVAPADTRTLDKLRIGGQSTGADSRQEPE